MSTYQQIVLASRPQGQVSPDNFRLEQVPVPSISDGQILIRNHYLSLDPYMRMRMEDVKSYAAPQAIGAVMVGGTVGEVVESRNPKYAVGDKVVGMLGWSEMGVSDGAGLRRVVASPEPQAILELEAIHTLVRTGAVVVCAGGGGIPVARSSDGRLHGVEAVVDKDLTAALLATDIDADTLVIATDVPNVMIDFGTPSARPLGRVTAAELREHAAGGQFARGSMGPKVEAALRFVEGGGARAVVTSLDTIADAVTGDAVGTVLQKDPPAPHRSRARGGALQEGHPRP